MPDPAASALTYNLYVTQVATMTVVQVQTTAGVVEGVDPEFNILIPQMLNYAELRIQRDLDILQSQVEDSSYTLVANDPRLPIDVNGFQVLQTVGVRTPAGLGVPLLPVTKEFLHNVYPEGSTPARPIYFAMTGGDTATMGNAFQNLMVGPIPDLDYPVVLTGVRRMPTLYSYANPIQANTETTFISSQLPDLLVQASMIYVSQYQRNFGAASNDPQMGPTYEAQYMTLLRGSGVEEARKRFQAAGWTSQSPAIAATPTRG